MKILYIGQESRHGFMDAIAMSVNVRSEGASHDTNHQVRMPFEYPQAIQGVVLVGNQNYIFQSQEYYFNFLQETQNREIRIAAILDRGSALPERNKGIGKIIETARGERTIASIA